MCTELSFPVFVVSERVWEDQVEASDFVVAVFLWLMDDKGAWRGRGLPSGPSVSPVGARI